MARSIQLANLRDFTGGVNYRADAFELADNESPDMLNVDVDPRGGFQQRKGAFVLPIRNSKPNLYTGSQARSEAASDWTGGNVTLARNTAQFPTGQNASIAVTSPTAATSTVYRTTAFPVTAAQVYGASARVKAASAGRSIQARIDWYNSSGGLISSTTGTAVTSTTTSWVTAGVSGTAPAGAVTAWHITIITAPVAGEIQFFSAPHFNTGTNQTVWQDPAWTGQLDAGVESITPFEVYGTSWGLVVSTGLGSLWYIDFLDAVGGWAAYPIGAWTVGVRGTPFKNTLLFPSYPNVTLRYAATTGVSLLGTAWNDNMAVPVGGNAPIAKFAASWNGSVWMAFTKESSVDYPNRVRWSHPNFPADYRSFDYIDIDQGADNDFITGIVPFQDKLLVFKNSAIYAIVGTEPDNFQVVTISRKVGAVSNDAIAPTEHGIYFFSWPNGVMFYDGRQVSPRFQKLLPLIDEGLIPENRYTSKIAMAFANRRLWVGVPWRASALDPEPTENTRTFVLDPSLSKEGSWVVYDFRPRSMFEMQLTAGKSYLLTSVVGKKQIIVLDYQGPATVTDNFGDGPLHISSYYRTRWVDLGEAAVRKRWRAPEVVLRSINDVSTIQVTVFRDYDPRQGKGSFNLETTVDESTLQWGGVWGETWRNPNQSPRSEVQRGSPLGTARAVQLLFEGPTTNHIFGVNSITMKYQPKPVRS